MTDRDHDLAHRAGLLIDDALMTIGVPSACDERAEELADAIRHHFEGRISDIDWSRAARLPYAIRLESLERIRSFVAHLEGRLTHEEPHADQTH